MFKKYFLNRRKRPGSLNAIPIVLIMAVIGVYLLVSSHAATPYASVTGSQGSLAGGANLQSDSTASTGQRVVFGRAVPMDGAVALALAAPGTPFAASSFWNTPLPASTPANPNNAAYVNEITNQLCYATFLTTPTTGTCTKSNVASLNSSNWSAPLYVVPANQPLVPVTRVCGTSPNTAFNNSVAGGVPVPADAHGAGETIVPDTDTDQEIQIYQPSTDREWEFWQFKKDSTGNWTACWGGGMSNVSQSNGIFPNNLGATATSLPLLGGIPRAEEFQAGQINHVMNLSLMYNLASGIPANVPGAAKPFSWPATRNDGGSTDPLAIPEGQRFRLNPSLDLSTLNLTAYAKTIAVAAQKYGFVVDDSAGTVNIRITDPTTYIVAGLPNPYSSGSGVGGVGNQGLFAGVSQGAIMKNFPWSQLQALPYNYGAPGSP
jgi:hypothetical protein